jgi:hypothetical protein
VMMIIMTTKQMISNMPMITMMMTKKVISNNADESDGDEDTDINEQE